MQCSAKPAVPGSQAEETSREQVKQKQGARFSRQFWRSLRSLEQAGTAVQRDEACSRPLD